MVEIDTLWNVKGGEDKKAHYHVIVEIDTLWNVKITAAMRSWMAIS